MAAGRRSTNSPVPSVGGYRSCDLKRPTKVASASCFPRFVWGCGKRVTNFGKGVLDIETINPTCLVWSAGPKGFGARDTVKGMVPGHVCIVKVRFTQVSKDRA